jgi:hypothetical protein
MIPFSSSDLIRLHSDVTSAVLSFLSFLVVHKIQRMNPPHRGRLLNEFPLSVFLCGLFLFWVGQERFVDTLDGTVGLGLACSNKRRRCVREKRQRASASWVLDALWEGACEMSRSASRGENNWQRREEL